MQPAPAISASNSVLRTVCSHYVPVNDAAVINTGWYNRQAKKLETARDPSDGDVQRAKMQSTVDAQVSRTGMTSPCSAVEILPDGRNKQERFFPSVTPESARVTYCWNSTPPEGKSEIIDRLLHRVTRLGHSSSLVSCRVVQEPPEISHIPGGGTVGLRNVRRGQLSELERRHASHLGVSPRALPYTDVRYRVAESAEDPKGCLKPNTLGEWFVFEFQHGSRMIPAFRAVELATTMRAAIFHFAKDPLPEGLSGHKPSGAPTSEPHVSFLPLPYVGFPHADGRLLGIAVSVPKTLDDHSREELYRAIGTWEEFAGPKNLMLKLGAKGEIYMSRVRETSVTVSLRQRVWCRPSSRWTTAAPIALPRHPGSLNRGTQNTRSRAWRKADDAVSAACAHVGLPKPTKVATKLSSFIVGGRTAGLYPAFRQNGPGGRQIRRQLVHASITFDQPVLGPLVLGAGRFFGLGLMRPCDETGKPSAETDVANG